MDGVGRGPIREGGTLAGFEGVREEEAREGLAVGAAGVGLRGAVRERIAKRRKERVV